MGPRVPFAPALLGQLFMIYIYIFFPPICTLYIIVYLLAQ